MKKILITGGAGFVGRHFCKYFLENGDKVIAVDNLSAFTGCLNPEDGWVSYKPFDFKNFIFYKNDCRDWFKENYDNDFDIVLHLAAMVGGREMIENNPLAVADDLSIDSEFWQWATRTKPKKIICFSSSACYPIKYQSKSQYVFLKEDMIDFNDDIGVPDLTYGWAKLTCEYLARIAHAKHNLNVVCYRPFSGYGSDQDINYPFPSICKRVLENKGKKNISVWGTGDQMRDFIHISDCVKGVITTMDKIVDGSAINLSTGKLTSFKQFVKIASNIIGFNPIVFGTSDKPEGVFARGGDTSLQADLGFNYSISFEEGIKNALETYSN